MEAFPDPATGDFTAARAWFQSHQPSGATVSQVNQNRIDVNKYTWTTTYIPDHTFPDPSQFQREEAKARFNRAARNLCLVKQCTAFKPSVTSQWLWKVEYAAKRSTLRLVDFIPCMSVFNSHSKTEKPSKMDQKTSSIKVRQTSANPRIKDCDILLADNTVISAKILPENTLCKKILLKGRNVTRHFFGKTRLSNFHAEFIRKFPNATSLSSKSVRFVRSEPKMTNPEDVPLPKDPEFDNNTIPYDYSTECKERIMYSRLRKPQVFRSALMYIAYKQFKKYPVVEITNPVQSVTELQNILRDEDLPIDEALLDVFYNYCTMRRIPKADLDLDVRKIFERAIRK